MIEVLREICKPILNWILSRRAYTGDPIRIQVPGDEGKIFWFRK
jgi:hypothetical protein